MNAYPPSAENQHYSASMLIIGVLFFIFGFVTWLNGPLTIFVKVAFHLDNVRAFFVEGAFYASYFVLALPSAAVLRRTGMKKEMAPGLIIMGTGLSLLQTASNPYVSILGSIESGARHIAIMGICNKAAGALAPIIFGWLVLSGIGNFAQEIGAAPNAAAATRLLDSFVAKVYWPYMVMAAILAMLAVWILRSPLREIAPGGTKAGTIGSDANHSLLRFPHLWLGVACIFAYVGVEVMAGDAIVIYGQALGLPLDAAKHFTTYTMIAMLIGYLLGAALIPRYIPQQRYLALSALLAILLTACAWATSGYTSVAFVAALGFANAMMWPALFPLAIKGPGWLAELGSALLIMGIMGGALPQICAYLAESIDFQDAFLFVMAPGYAYILFYGAFGYRVGQLQPGRTPQPGSAKG